MWIVKNESANPVRLPELGLEIAPKEYLDLDARGRERAEAAPSLKAALDRGTLRTISKASAEAASKPASASPLGGALKDLAERPPTAGRPRLFIPEGGGEPVEDAVVGVKESFLRSFRKKKEEPDPENLPPDVLLIRKELERFRKSLLEDIHNILNDYLRP